MLLWLHLIENSGSHNIRHSMRNTPHIERWHCLGKLTLWFNVRHVIKRSAYISFRLSYYQPAKQSGLLPLAEVRWKNKAEMLIHFLADTQASVCCQYRYRYWDRYFNWMEVIHLCRFHSLLFKSFSSIIQIHECKPNWICHGNYLAGLGRVQLESHFQKFRFYLFKIAVLLRSPKISAPKCMRIAYWMWNHSGMRFHNLCEYLPRLNDRTPICPTSTPYTVHKTSYELFISDSDLLH